MSVDARRACIARRHRRNRSPPVVVAEKNPAGIGNCRILGALLGFVMSYSQMTGLRMLLPAMRPVLLIALASPDAEVCHLAIAPKEPVNSRADRAVANHVGQIVDPVGFAVVQGDALTQKAEIHGLRVLV